MSMESNINKYYFHQFFGSLSFWLPISILYFLKYNLTYFHIMSFIVITSIFHLIFEVPSGVYADYFGRKSAITLSSIFWFSNVVFLFFGNSFLPFLIGSAFFGLCLAFGSGSLSAFIYDTLKDLGREKEYKRINGIGFSYHLLGMGVGAFFGGFLSEISFKVPIFATLISSIIAIIITFFFIEPKHHKKSEDRNYFVHLKEAIKFTKNHYRIKWLFLFAGSMVTVMVISHRLLQPYMQLVGLPVKYFGIMYLLFLLFSSFIARYIYVIERKLGEFYSLLIIPLFLGFHLIFMAKFLTFFGILVIFLGQFTWGLIHPLISDYINRHVESHHRATVLSLGGFFRSILLIIITPFFGYLADVFSLTTALLIDGIFALIIGLPLLFKIFRK